MSAITGKPNAYDFGYQFNYALWTAETVITLTNVPWDNNYKDIVKFANRAALNAYIDSKGGANTKIENMSYAKVGLPVRLDIPFNVAMKYSYLRASNPVQPIPGQDVQKDYYYFISDVRYIAPNTTEVVVNLDIWQTFGYDVTFGNCYIERGHIGIANSSAFDNYGREYLTVPEGLNVGTEYRNITHHEIKVSEISISNGGYEFYDYLVASTVDLNADPGTADNPKLVTASGGGIQGLSSGATYYVFQAARFENFLKNYQNLPWVTQGIISITVIPNISRYFPGFAYSGPPSPSNPSGSVKAPATFSFTRRNTGFSDWRNSPEVLERIPARYRHLKKFLTSPYMIIEMTTWNGTPVILKPEMWQDHSARINERIAIMPPNQRIVFWPLRYNANDKDSVIDTDFPTFVGVWPGYAGGDGDDGGDYLDVSTMISSFPTIAIVNNGAIGYLAANNSQIAFSQQNADWSQQKALRGANTSYDNTKVGIEANKNLSEIGRNADAASTYLGNATAQQQLIAGGVSSIGQGAVGGATGGPAGAGIGAGMGALNAISAGVSSTIQQNSNVEALAIRRGASSDSNRTSTNADSYANINNRSLAEWASKGDYENAIAGIQAKVQDAAMIQPSTSGQLGGDTMNFVYNNVEVSLRWKTIHEAAMREIGDYWLRYGYAVSQYGKMPASLMVMTKFTYWKLVEVYLTGGGMPESFKQTIRGIFEKGVTVWANPADIGNIDIANNAPLGGITL